MKTLFIPPNSSGIGHLSLEAINYAGRFAGIHHYDKFLCMVDNNIFICHEFAEIMHDWFEYVIVNFNSTKYNMVINSWECACSHLFWSEKHAYRIFSERFPRALEIYPYPYYSQHKVLRALNSRLDLIYDKKVLTMLTINTLKTSNIGSPYIVIHIRDTPANLTSDPSRNVPLGAYEFIIKYWLNAGYSVVRIGYGAPIPIKHKKLHDYHAIFAHPNTLSLIAGSSLFIGCQSGPSAFAGIFGIPCILLNILDEVDVLLVHDFPNYHIIPACILLSESYKFRLIEVFNSLIECRQVDERLSPNVRLFRHACLHL